MEEEKKGGRRVNRPRWEGRNKRYVTKILKKKNWYKGGKREDEKTVDRDDRGEHRRDRWIATEKGGGKEELEPETFLFIPSTALKYSKKQTGTLEREPILDQ